MARLTLTHTLTLSLRFLYQARMLSIALILSMQGASTAVRFSGRASDPTYTWLDSIRGGVIT